MSVFVATLLGAAVGVIAGALIQYLSQILIDRYNRKKVLADVRTEAEYNLAIARQMLGEVAKFRAAAQPATFQAYQWYFRSQDMLAIALNRVTNSGELYRLFDHNEILEIQSMRQFFSPQFERQFISDQINLHKTNSDIPEAHQFANFLDAELNKHIVVLQNLTKKK